MFFPSKKTAPDEGGSRYSMHLAIVVFPHPLSPTKPRVSFRFIWKETWSTACTSPILRLSITPLHKRESVLLGLLFQTLFSSFLVRSVRRVLGRVPFLDGNLLIVH